MDRTRNIRAKYYALTKENDIGTLKINIKPIVGRREMNKVSYRKRMQNHKKFQKLKKGLQKY